MPYTVNTRHYVGKGSFYLGRRDGGGGVIRRLGNTSAMTLTINEETISQQDYESAGGGEAESLSRISSIEGSATVHEFSPENAALALRGDTTNIAAGPEAGEKHIAYPGGLIPFEYLPDPDVAFVIANDTPAAWAADTLYAAGDFITDTGRLYKVTVGGTSGSSAPTFPTDGSTVIDNEVTWIDVGTPVTITSDHYEVKRVGIYILEDAPLPALGTPITAGYTKNASVVVEALTNSGYEYILYFDGLNEADSGNPVPAEFYRIKFTPASGKPYIGDEFGGLELGFRVLRDATKTGAGTSQFFKETYVAE